MEFVDRLRWLLDQFDNRVQAGEVAGVTPEYLPSYLKGNAKPRFETIAKLAAAKNVSLDWLATGQGTPWPADGDGDSFVAVALLADAEARYDDGTAAPYLFSRAWLRTLTAVPEDALRIAIHRDNSNEPVIREGDAMLVDTTLRLLTRNGLYVFLHDGKHQAKFVETLLTGRVALKSRHRDYDVQNLSPDEAAQLQVLGRVCWRGGIV